MCEKSNISSHDSSQMMSHDSSASSTSLHAVGVVLFVQFIGNVYFFSIYVSREIYFLRKMVSREICFLRKKAEKLVLESLVRVLQEVIKKI